MRVQKILPLRTGAEPRSHLQLVQAVAVLSVLHHPSEHQDPRPLADEPMSRAPRRDVSPHRRQEPLPGHYTSAKTRRKHEDFTVALLVRTNVCGCVLKINNYESSSYRDRGLDRRTRPGNYMCGMQLNSTFVRTRCTTDNCC